MSGLAPPGVVEANAPATVRGEHDARRYFRKCVLRAGMRTLIRPLVSWKPMAAPKDGYTILIGCTQRLVSMIWANLSMLDRCDMAGCDGVLIGIDCVPGELGIDLEAKAKQVAPNLNVTFLYYTPTQARITRLINWGWVYSWLNWSKGISQTRTKYAFLHDFDALLLNPAIMRERWELIRSMGVEYLGHSYYDGHGVSPADKMVTTFELMFDAEHVRRNHRPIELFNTMARFKGRRVEFDTFLNAQSKGGTRFSTPILPHEMVHPSEMIVQFVDFNAGRDRTPAKNNLMMIPYYQALGGDFGLLDDLSAQMKSGKRVVTLWGRPLDLSRMSWVHADWLRGLGFQVEAHVVGGVRPAVRDYFEGLVAVAAPQQ
jgi:hypothetical protein